MRGTRIRRVGAASGAPWARSVAAAVVEDGGPQVLVPGLSGLRMPCSGSGRYAKYSRRPLQRAGTASAGSARSCYRPTPFSGGRPFEGPGRGKARRCTGGPSRFQNRRGERLRRSDSERVVARGELRAMLGEALELRGFECRGGATNGEPAFGGDLFDEVEVDEAGQHFGASAGREAR